jgi:hypothetical protein
MKSTVGWIFIQTFLQFQNKFLLCCFFNPPQIFNISNGHYKPVNNYVEELSGFLNNIYFVMLTSKNTLKCYQFSLIINIISVTNEKTV